MDVLHMLVMRRLFRCVACVRWRRAFELAGFVRWRDSVGVTSGVGSVGRGGVVWLLAAAAFFFCFCRFLAALLSAGMLVVVGRGGMRMLCRSVVEDEGCSMLSR